MIERWEVLVKEKSLLVVCPVDVVQVDWYE